MLTTLNAAVLITDAEVREKLEKTVLQLINDESELARLSKNISPLGYQDAADIIANEAVKLANSSSK